MKRTISMACLLLVAAVGTLAQHWTMNARAWQYDMTAYVQLKVNGQTVSDYADYEVAAFCDDECRGVAKVLTVEGEKPVLYLRIRSNVTGEETITFRVYQTSTDEETLLEESLVFEAQTVAGTPGEPMMLTKGSVILGDVNSDGDVDIADAVCIVNHVVGKATPAFNEQAADVNADGDIDIADAVRIVNLVVGKIDALSRRLHEQNDMREPE